MLLYYYMGIGRQGHPGLDEAYVDREAESLGTEVTAFWRTIKAAAHKAAGT
jgi:hypothetical protein